MTKNSDWEGQLCPYNDCCWKCELDKPGWWICPHCNRPFYAEINEGETEEYNAYRADERQRIPQQRHVPMAGDRGPSWGTPTAEAQPQ